MATFGQLVAGYWQVCEKRRAEKSIYVFNNILMGSVFNCTDLQRLSGSQYQPA